MIRQWLQRRKENLYMRGWDYAAGRLLQDGARAIKILRSQVDCASDFGSFNEFDAGIENAIAKWEYNTTKEATRAL